MALCFLMQNSSSHMYFRIQKHGAYATTGIMEQPQQGLPLEGSTIYVLHTYAPIFPSLAHTSTPSYQLLVCVSQIP